MKSLAFLLPLCLFAATAFCQIPNLNRHGTILSCAAPGDCQTLKSRLVITDENLQLFPWAKAEGLPAQLQSESQVQALGKLIAHFQKVATGRGLSSVMGIMEENDIPEQHLVGFAEVQIVNQTDGSYLLQVYQEFAPEGQMTAHHNSWEMIEARIPPVETIWLRGNSYTHTVQGKVIEGRF
jgi:hypothetical protein